MKNKTYIWLGGILAILAVLNQVFDWGITNKELDRVESLVLGMQNEPGFEEFRVEQVVDGDTIKLADGRTVRYIGIDTPETKHPQKQVECYGREASLANESLVEGKNIKLVRDVSETDRYGRVLAYVFVGDELVNETLVKQGYAQAVSYPPDIKYQERFRRAEEFARKNNLGLWGSCPKKDK